MIFFVVASLFLFYQKSKTLNIYADTINIPIMELKESRIYNITYQGINAYLRSKIAKKYKDRYELYKIYSSKKDNDIDEKLWADKGILKDDILSLFGHVLYKDNKNQTLSSDRVIYDIKKDILSSNTPFKILYKNSEVTGSSFVYYKGKKRLVAENIRGIYRDSVSKYNNGGI